MENGTNMNTTDEMLRQIKRVEPTPFLFTRIQAKLEEQFSLRVSKKMAWGCAMGMVVLTGLNIWIFNHHQHERQDDLVQQLNLVESQQIYQ